MVTILRKKDPASKKFGETTEYEVKAVEVLAPSAVEEITSGNYDLTLFTCTYGGRSRIAVNCDRK